MTDRALPSKAVKGLPGFLRRTLRTYEQEEETEQSGVSASAKFVAEEERNSSHLQIKSDGSRSTQPKESKELTSSEPSTTEETVESFPRVEPRLSNKAIPPSQTIPDKPHKFLLERKVSYKQKEFEIGISADLVNMTDLKKLAWNGIPPEHRAQAWKIMLGYVPVNKLRRNQALERKRAEYLDAISQHYDIDDDIRTVQEQETLRQVLVDVPRTAPEVGLFRDDRIRRCLSRLLYIWAMRHPASSYVQGINDLATPLVVVFLSSYCDGQDVLDGSVMARISDEIVQEIEADVYWCITSLLAGIQDHYTADQPGVQRMVAHLEDLVNRIDSNLSDHLRSVGVEFMQFAFKWMNCLLLREFNLRCVIRLWDTYISEGDGGFEDFHVYVCAAFLCQFSTQLQTMSFDEMFGFLQHMPTDEWIDTDVEMLLSQAFVLSTLFGGSDAHLVSAQRL